MIPIAYDALEMLQYHHTYDAVAHQLDITPFECAKLLRALASHGLVNINDIISPAYFTLTESGLSALKARPTERKGIKLMPRHLGII